MDYTQTLSWVTKVVISCETEEQFKSAEKLYAAFKKQFPKIEEKPNKFKQILKTIKHELLPYSKL